MDASAGRGAPETLPSNLIFAKMRTLLGVTGKDEAIWQPSSSQSYVLSTTQNVDFTIWIPPGNGFWDVESSGLRFTVTVATSAGGGLATRGRANAFAFFKRLMIRTPDRTLELIEDWGRYCQKVLTTVGQDFMSYSGNVQVGSAMTTAESIDMINTNGTTYQFFVPLVGTGLFHGSSKMYPSSLTSKPIGLQFWFETVGNIFGDLDAADPVPPVTVSNIAFVVNQLSFDPSFTSAVRDELMREGALRWATTTVQTQPINLIMETNVDAVVNLSFRAKILSIIGWMTLATETPQNSMPTQTTKLNGLQQFQFFVGGTPYPSNPVVVSAQQSAHCFARFLECFSILNDVRAPTAINYPTYTRTDNNNSRFVFGYDFRPMSRAGKYANNNKDLTMSPQQLIWRAKFGTREACTLYFAAALYCVYEVDTTGDVRTLL